ncbi:MAG: VOC family protein [Streptococcaceae bacterium]|jgi:catechol 2,3-dioxygenase-like lactoylglutathione lyase family enzyme|nr:VOC family protein [Streptococcaceae bacterium]
MKAHHISLITADVDRNIDYYTNILGLRLIKNSINQANFKVRHVYYGDFSGSPGSVVTFFAIPAFKRRERVDGSQYISGIHLSIPNGTSEFWKGRLTQKGFAAEINGRGQVKTLDPDNIPLTLHENEKINFDWHINYFSDIPYGKQITGITGTELHVPNIDATAKFFKDVFNLETKGNIVNLDTDHALYLFETESTAPKSKWGKGSVDHIALDALNQAELEKYWEIALVHGYKRELMVDRGYFRSIYLREPGGNRIEIATNSPGFTLDESLLELGSKFSLPPRFTGNQQEIFDFYEKEGVRFDDASPYTGTGHLSGEVEVIFGEASSETTIN